MNLTEQQIQHILTALEYCKMSGVHFENGLDYPELNNLLRHLESCSRADSELVVQAEDLLYWAEWCEGIAWSDRKADMDAAHRERLRKVAKALRAAAVKLDGEES